jgi:large subunit ribosomal protein L24
MATLSTQPRRQRLARFNADLFERRRRMAVPLSRELRRRYGRRSLPVRKGDTVRILSGSYKGREERVAKVDRQWYSVTLDNVTTKTGDQKLKPLPIQLTHLVLTRLNLSDAWRRRVLKVPEGEVVGEPEAGATPEGPPAEAKA